MPSPPLERNAAIISSSLARGWLTVARPSAHSPTQRGRVHADRRPDQRRRLRRQRVQLGPVDPHQPVVRDRLAGEQRAHDLDALAQAGVAGGLVGPRVAGDVLVGRLAGAERDPQPPGEHLAQRGRGLGDDRRVVALARRVDHPERQRRRRHRRAEPRPCEARLALAFAPRREVVRGHDRPEARRLGVPWRARAGGWAGSARASSEGRRPARRASTRDNRFPDTTRMPTELRLRLRERQSACCRPALQDRRTGLAERGSVWARVAAAWADGGWEPSGGRWRADVDVRRTVSGRACP